MACFLPMISMSRRNLLQFTGQSIYCAQADVHIDPWQPVEMAIITHAHSDHARWGSNHYLSHHDSAPILRQRLGSDISLQTVGYGEVFHINGVAFSMHPAGHIIGSAQIRVEHKGEVWVVSGDYKLEDDGFAPPFEPISCHVFITESTFGLPIYRWKPQQDIYAEIENWWSKNAEEGKASLLMGYALGKTQRILKGIDTEDRKLFAHGAIFSLNQTLRQAGHDLPEITLITSEMDRKQLAGALVLAPPSAGAGPWLRKLGPVSTGYCSGWMAIRGAKNRRAIDQGFVLSDHADWNDLNTAIKATGAERVFVTHGFTSTFARWLREQGLDAQEVQTMYGNEEITETQALELESDHNTEIIE